MNLRLAKDRGFYENEWLKSYHSFSFGEYYDPQFMNFNHLKVINEDFIAPRKGFATHPHKNMEILTYVISGAVEHQDSLGNHMIINQGEIQRMSAGSGVFHSEYNPLHDQELHLLQMWVEPNVYNIKPSYEQTETLIHQVPNQLHCLAAPQPRDNSLLIHQDAYIYGGRFESDQIILLEHEQHCDYWIQVIKGHLSLGEKHLSKSDAMGLENQKSIQLRVNDRSEVLIFQFPRSEFGLM